MDFLGVALRHAIPQVAEYAPYSFSGAWDECDKDTIKATIDPHVPAAVYPTFNNWIFAQWGPGHYYARRATWDMGGLNAKTAQGLADEIKQYYSESGLG